MKLERLLASYDSGGGIFQAFVEISNNGCILKGVGLSEESEREAIWQAVRTALKAVNIEIGSYQGHKGSRLTAFAKKTIFEVSSFKPG